MTATTAYYRHSGRFSPLDLLIGLVAGGAAAVLLAFGYAYAILYIPVAGYITFILSAAFGGAVGGATAWVMVKRNVRSGAAVTLTCLVVTLLAFWLHWCVWVFAFLRRSDVPAELQVILLKPQLLWALLERINAVGSFTLKGNIAPKGTFLWVLWGLEGAIILGTSLLAAKALVGARPFCETCEQWAKGPELVGMFGGVASTSDLRASLERKDLTALERLGAPSTGAWVKVSLHSCPRCGQLNTLTVVAVTVRHGKKGERTENARNVATDLLVTRREVDAVREMARRVSAIQSAPASGGAAG